MHKAWNDSVSTVSGAAQYRVYFGRKCDVFSSLSSFDPFNLVNIGRHSSIGFQDSGLELRSDPLSWRLELWEMWIHQGFEDHRYQTIRW